MKLKVIARSQWFDEDVRREVEARGQAGLEKAAAYLKTAIQRSMRRKGSPSKPGEPPAARTDRKHGGALRNLVAYAWDPAGKVAVVGPLPLPGRKATVPALHEFGGTAPNDRVRIRRIGQGGEIRILSAKQGKRHRGKVRRAVKAEGAEQRKERGKGRKLVGTVRVVRVGPAKGDVEYVAYAKLRTAKQAALASKLNRELVGKVATFRYPQRSYVHATAKRIEGDLRRHFGREALKGLRAGRRSVA